MFDASYTSRSRASTTRTTVEDNQGFNAGGNARGDYSLLDPTLNLHLGFSDVPHRFVGDVPLRAAVRPRQVRSASGRAERARAAAGRWAAACSGSRASRSRSAARARGALARPDRVAGVDFEVPENLQGWYDGGRRSRCRADARSRRRPTYLSYNPDAFAGRVVTAPNGRIVADQFWYGTPSWPTTRSAPTTASTST